MRITPSLFAPLGIALMLAGCHSGAVDESAATPAATDTPAAASEEAKPYDGIEADERLDFTGTEPFWGGHVAGRTLTYDTPEDPSGEVIQIERFSGRGGVSFSGLLDGKDFNMTVTPLSCSDGMSDRTYPFTVTLKLGEETRNGCGWTEKQPFEGPAQP